MSTIISKRHLLKFYLAIIIISLILIAFGAIFLYFYIKAALSGDLPLKENLLPILSFFCLFFAVYTVYRYFKNAPIISLGKDDIKFNNKSFLLADLDNMELTGKQIFKYAFGYPMEAATLHFKNGVTKYIFDDLYSNAWEIKSILKQVVMEKKEFPIFHSSPLDMNSVENDVYQTYKGNQFPSLRGILLWGLIGVFAYVTFKEERPIPAGMILFLFGFYVFWFFAISNQMRYFQVSDNYLLIRNHNLSWKKKAYHLSDIKEIVFERPAKLPYSLRVITYDFKSKLYQAGTLRDKTWLKLKEKLEAYPIKVRNEFV